MKLFRLAYVSFALVTLVGCFPTPPGGSSPGTGGAETTSGPRDGETTPGPGDGETSPGPGDGETTPGPGDGESTPPTDINGPDFTLYSAPECSVIPGGSLSGADNLTIFVSVRNGGPGLFSRLVPYELRSDTGLSGGGSSSLSTGASFTAMQVDLKSSDYDRTHRFTITADPANTVVERSESNNSLIVQVSLPARPGGTTNVTCSVG